LAHSKTKRRSKPVRKKNGKQNDVKRSVIGAALFAGLQTQLEGIPLLLEDATSAAILHRPPSGKWSAHENLAHVARYHEIFIERVSRMLTENNPVLPRYRAEEDPLWPSWAALPTEEILRRLKILRRRVVALLEPLTRAQMSRRGVHPVFGEMSIQLWTEFFLVHEGHHLYVALQQVRANG